MEVGSCYVREMKTITAGHVYAVQFRGVNAPRAPTVRSGTDMPPMASLLGLLPAEEATSPILHARGGRGGARGVRGKAFVGRATRRGRGRSSAAALPGAPGTSSDGGAQHASSDSKPDDESAARKKAKPGSVGKRTMGPAVRAGYMHGRYEKTKSDKQEEWWCKEYRSLLAKAKDGEFGFIVKPYALALETMLAPASRRESAATEGTPTSARSADRCRILHKCASVAHRRLVV